MRRDYLIFPIFINGKKIVRVVIDEHVDKHSDHIDDFLILKIVKQLDGECFESISDEESFSYYVTKIKQDQNWYKLVWLLEKNCNYLGILTLFRDKRIFK